MLSKPTYSPTDPIQINRVRRANPEGLTHCPLTGSGEPHEEHYHEYVWTRTESRITYSAIYGYGCVGLRAKAPSYS
jgi:hypothetical protein